MTFAIWRRFKDGFDQWADWFSPAPANGPVGDYQFTPGQTYALYPQLGNTSLITLVLPNQVRLRPSSHTRMSATVLQHTR